ncbi:MAG: hypothetical protein HYY66_08750, partial [Candidatus Tectomicrobia bacterium]|nr:hypothetical protein [Candidatus Tectomicrobia bacterium]
SFTHPNYHPYELIPFGPYAAILNLAHIVVARAGLSTIAELSAAGVLRRNGLVSGGCSSRPDGRWRCRAPASASPATSTSANSPTSPARATGTT